MPWKMIVKTNARIAVLCKIVLFLYIGFQLAPIFTLFLTGRVDAIDAEFEVLQYLGLIAVEDNNYIM
jgi:hypothetical protein